MSKTTKKYGKPVYTMYINVEATPSPNARLTAQAVELDRVAIKEYNKPYDALNGSDKSQLHLNIKEGKYKEK